VVSMYTINDYLLICIKCGFVYDETEEIREYKHSSLYEREYDICKCPNCNDNAIDNYALTHKQKKQYLNID
jgi:rubredoxin